MAGLSIVGGSVLPPTLQVRAEAQIGSPVPAGGPSFGIAANPVTNRIYVANPGTSTVTVIDGATNAIIGKPVVVEKDAEGIGVNPVTNRVYVASSGSGSVTVIDGATNA